MAKNDETLVIGRKAEDLELRMKSNDQAKNAILQFLTELGIDRIIYVDDRCSIQELKEAFIAKLKEKYRSKPLEIDFVNWNEPQPKFEKAIVDLWESSADEIKRDLFLKILKHDGNSDEIENSTAPLNLKNHLNDKIDLFSPSEWEERKDQVIGELSSETKILFLFDIEFEHAPLPSGRNGIDLAEELLNNQAIKEFVYCGIFSHLFTVSEEIIKRNEYQENRGFNKSRFYTISKKRFRDDSYLPGLAEGIRNALLVYEVELLKKVTESILKKSFTNSFTEIQDLDPESFNHIIVHSSYQEGTWEMLSLIRLESIITQDIAFKKLLSKSKRAKINGYLNNIRKIKDIQTGGSTPFDKGQVRYLREKELYIHSDIINQLHFPISNGDIFKIKGKEYILIGQPCNLALRKTGCRDIMSGKVYDSGFLLRIDTIKKERFNQFRPGQLATMGVLQNTDLSSDKIKFVRFQLYKTVSLSPLDLTVYNTDGTASINLNKMEHDSVTIQESWRLRYKKLHEEFSNYRDNIRTFKKLKSSSKDNLKNLIFYGEIFKDYSINNDNVLNRSGNKVTLNIKRTSHYREPYSSDLLQQFMQYLSRNAFDHDFLND